MTTTDSVHKQVAAIVHRHLDDKFGGNLVFDPIVVVPRFSPYLEDEYLHIYIIFEGDGDLLDPGWLNSLNRRMRPALLKLGVTNIPVASYIDKSEITSWTDEEKAALFG